MSRHDDHLGWVGDRAPWRQDDDEDEAAAHAEHVQEAWVPHVEEPLASEKKFL